MAPVSLPPSYGAGEIVDPETLVQALFSPLSKISSHCGSDSALGYGKKQTDDLEKPSTPANAT
ncbi:hypothetical protein MASR1M12_19920 [Erysipelotrichia bacterium]